jgi:FolB domain-containing protein
MSQDCLRINNLQVKSHIGCTSEELMWPQMLVVNAKLYNCFIKSANTDQLTDAVDYVGAIKVISQTCAEGKRHLLEKLVSDISDNLFLAFHTLTKVEISVDKRVSELCQSVTASIVRERKN